MKIIYSFILILTSYLVTMGQVYSTAGTGAPSGACTTGIITYTNQNTGQFYTCVAGAWNLTTASATAQAALPISTAEQTALNLKADLAGPTFTGTVNGITKSMIGLGNVDNTSDVSKPVSTVQQTAFNLKADLTSPTFSTSAISPLWRSTTAKWLIQGIGSGPTEFSATQTTAPTCSSNCGTSPSVVGSNTFMRVTMGASGVPASGWVVTFNGPGWAAAPACIVQMGKAGMVVGKMPLTVVETTTTITVVTNGTAPSTTDIYKIHCGGTQ